MLYVQKFLNAKYSLATLIWSSVLLALWGIWYGLPLHLIGDEESVIGGALKMLELHVFIPSLQPEAFDFLYYPVLIPYLIIIFSLPSIIVQWFASAFSIQQVIDYFALHQESIWVAARLISVIASGCMVYVTYKLGELVYSRAVGLIAGLFLITSFLHIQAGHFPRHWMLATFIAYLTIYIMIRYVRKGDLAWWLPSVVAGISVGVSYISLFSLAFVVPYMFYKRAVIPYWFKRFIGSALICFLIAGLLSVLHLHELVKLLGTEDGSVAQAKNFWALRDTFFYALRTLFAQDPWLLLCALGGLLFAPLYRRQNLTMGVFAVLYCFVLYLLFHIETRYVYFMVPGLALVGATFVEKVIRGRFGAVATVVVLCGFLYAAAVVVRYDVMLSRPDTRQLAIQWIERTIQKDEFVMWSRSLVLPRTVEALERERTLGRLRSNERYLAEHFDRVAPLAGTLYSYSNAYFWNEATSDMTHEYIQKWQPRYAVIENPFEEEISSAPRAFFEGALVAEFSQSTAETSIDVNGNFFEPSASLFGLTNLGPRVRIYELQ